MQVRDELAGGGERERRVYGPPGTGKTTYMARQLKNAASKFGRHNIMVASFTTTAAQEIAGRDTGIPKKQIATLHGHCYRALNEWVGHWEIAETKIKDWNQFAPMYAMSDGGSIDLEDQAVEGRFQTQGDEYMAQYQMLRAKMIPYDSFPQSIKYFADKWKAFKNETYCMDFTDMIEWCYDSVEIPPGSPAIGFFDETQDFTPLELALIRKWGSKMERIVLAGDDDQCIYGFKGSTPEAFLIPDISPEYKRVLSQSYRVPRAVLEVADKFIKQVKTREPKEYKPRDFDGEVRRLAQGNFKNIDPILKDAEQYLAQGKSIMFLASCGYMLDSLKKALRDSGTPFHNPYRRKRYDWNPLITSGTSSKDRLLAYLRVDRAVHGDKASMWTGNDLARWTDHIRSKGIFKRGGKSGLSEMEGEEEVPIIHLLDFFEEEAIVELISLETTEQRINWLQDNLLATKAKAYEYPIKILNSRGADALRETPKIILGSIHSVKGGEADVVYLFPDLSISGMREYLNPRQKDGVIRQFYVGMTRARESLILCSNATSYRVKI